MQYDEQRRKFSCPRCGAEMHYDAATGLWLCPLIECGTAVRYEVQGAGGPPPEAPAECEGFEGEWQPEQPGRGRRAIVLVGAVVIIIAVLAMLLQPLLWPRRPVLSVSPQSIEFDDAAGIVALPKAFAIQNDGTGELVWTATADREWLQIEPPSGVLADGVEVVVVSVDLHGLPAGSHAATITVVADGAYHSPQVVSVLVTLALPAEGRALMHMLGQGAEVYYDRQPPYVEGPVGRPIQLRNNEDAVDVSWAALLQFILEDDTDEVAYVEDLMMCGSFAERLHNNAEAQGIRCAWVSVDFVGEDCGHALNAFVTTDRGLVFIDSTGENPSLVAAAGGEAGVCDADKAAYVRVGSPYGLVSLEYADSPAYEFYEEYSAAWADYTVELDEYNLLVTEYNRLVDAGSSASLRKARHLAAELETRRLQLELVQEVLGPCYWSPLGIVESLSVYW